MSDERANAYFALIGQETDRFCLALGKLMMRWADTEMSIYRVLLHYGKLDDETGRSIFSGARSKVMINAIKAIAENKAFDAALVRDLEFTFAQITTVGTVRDMLAHYGSMRGFGWSGHPGNRSINNANRARIFKNATFLEVSADTINLLTQDLLTCQHRLEVHLVEPLVLVDEATWLYRSPQPTGSPAQSSSKSPKRTRPQRPSRGKP